MEVWKPMYLFHSIDVRKIEARLGYEIGDSLNIELTSFLLSDMFYDISSFPFLSGCVITYDIITGWNPIQLYDQYVSSIIVSDCNEFFEMKYAYCIMSKAKATL